MSDVFNLQIIEVLIAIVFIYAVLSILVSLISETLVSYFGYRATFLQDKIQHILNDPFNLNYAELFYNHPSIDKLKQTNTNWWHVFIRWKQQVGAGYIASNTFADALVDVLISRTNHLNKLEVKKTDEGIQFVTASSESNVNTDALQVRFMHALNQMEPSPLRDILEGFHLKAGASTDQNSPHYATQLKTLIMGWFDDHMTQASIEYKRKQRLPLLLVSAAVVLLLNVDSIYMLKKIIAEPQLRAELNSQANQMVDQMKAQNNTDLTTQKLLTMVSNLKIDSARLREIDAKEKLTLLQVIEPKDSFAISHLLHELSNADQRAKDSLRDVRESYARELNMLPIGYDPQEAPLSWRKSEESCCTNSENASTNSSVRVSSNEKTATGTTYFEARRRGDSGARWLYFTGLVISIFSLSLGAPFWFDALSKLVNIRRGAIKSIKTN